MDTVKSDYKLLSLENVTLQELIENKRYVEKNFNPNDSHSELNKLDKELIIGESFTKSLIETPFIQYNSATPVNRNRSEAHQRYRSVRNLSQRQFNDQLKNCYSPESIASKSDSI